MGKFHRVPFLLVLVLVALLATGLSVSAQDDATIVFATASPDANETVQPEPTAAPGEDATAVPTPDATAISETDASLIFEILDAQPDLINAITRETISQIGQVYSQDKAAGTIQLVGFIIAFCFVGFLLYRSSPPDRREQTGRQIVGGASNIVKEIDKFDPIPGTDIENRLLKTISGWLDERLDGKMATLAQASATAAADAAHNAVSKLIDDERAKLTAMAENPMLTVDEMAAERARQRYAATLAEAGG